MLPDFWLKGIIKPVVNDNLIVYHFCRVPYSLTCSPLLLVATLKYRLQKEVTALAVNNIRICRQ